MIDKVSDTKLHDLMGKGTVLIQFSAVWCGPCKGAKKQLEVAKANIPGVKVVTVDIDQSTRAVHSFGLRSVPTLVLVKSGVEVDRRVGVTSANEIVAMVQQHT